MIKRIGVLTSGGDAPGMNAAVRAITRTALRHNAEVFAIANGYAGILKKEIRKLHTFDVSDIITRGGSILGSGRYEAFKESKIYQKGAALLRTYEIDALVVIGGDGSYQGARALTAEGINCIGVPGTIDNDIPGTDFTIGFDTALNTIVEAVDKIRDTSSSHRRANVVEVMGRYAGDLAIWSGLACGAEAIFIPEKERSVLEVLDQIKESYNRGKRHAIIILAEGCIKQGLVKSADEMARLITERAEFDTRVTVLGHIQRGGAPTALDRIRGSRLGEYAVELLMEGKGGRCVGIRNDQIIDTSIMEALETMPHTPALAMYDLAYKLV